MKKSHSYFTLLAAFGLSLLFLTQVLSASDKGLPLPVSMSQETAQQTEPNLQSQMTEAPLDMTPVGGVHIDLSSQPDDVVAMESAQDRVRRWVNETAASARETVQKIQLPEPDFKAVQKKISDFQWQKKWSAWTADLQKSYEKNTAFAGTKAAEFQTQWNAFWSARMQYMKEFYHDFTTKRPAGNGKTALVSAAPVKKVPAESKAAPVKNETLKPVIAPRITVAPETSKEVKAVMPQAAVSAAKAPAAQQPVKAEAKPLETQRVTAGENGTHVIERFNEQSLRFEKKIMTSENQILERWLFDKTEPDKILRYEKHDFENAVRVKYRIAEWEYAHDGSSVKISRVFDADQKRTAIYYEHFNANQVKEAEEWFNNSGEMVSQKLWDPSTGAFKQHIYVKEFGKGQKKVQWLAENGRKEKEVILSKSGKGLPFKFIQLGGSYEADPYRRLRNRDQGRQRPGHFV